MTAWNDYANDVKTGKIAACKRVKQAVNRYFWGSYTPVLKHYQPDNQQSNYGNLPELHQCGRHG
ncbi:hypothetical protein GTE46_001921 [Salmonella enterica subsp. enterica]|uniref:Uncharacterized protein n=3 Tax=Salmonella enterica TaxID=28901 RepID=A0A7Z0Y4H8_SALDZ|nr:hypothetical protein [Salmonella enterica]EDY2185432.1 hypothetical protein [Salmonella enterica subsp. enterica]OSG81607.1 hypothetical protein R545_14230 [Salmonella enterica subsp. diarizonae serovar Rough:r:z]EAM2984551.1 hypothetical protein [Salmonella enterica]EAM9431820.1 hypothetical protein [Salmonella enterica]